MGKKSLQESSSKFVLGQKSVFTLKTRSEKPSIRHFCISRKCAKVYSLNEITYAEEFTVQEMTELAETGFT